MTTIDPPDDTGAMLAAAHGPLPTVAQVAAMIDHALLRPELTRTEVAEGLEIARRHGVASVCVRPSDVAAAAAALAGSPVEVGTVVGFPHGGHTVATKVHETAELVGLGATEIDVVIQIGRLVEGDAGYVREEVAAVVAAASDAPVKVIFENAYLTDDQKVAGYRAAAEAGAAYVKTSTGFAASGATAHDVALMRRSVPASVKVKAAGGIRDLDTLLEMRALGADRIGASATEAILADLAARLDSLSA